MDSLREMRRQQEWRESRPTCRCGAILVEQYPDNTASLCEDCGYPPADCRCEGDS